MIGEIVEGTALLISVGINGLALWHFKDYKLKVSELDFLQMKHHSLRKQLQFADDQNIELLVDNAELRAKLTPWNKGKKGYHNKSRTRAIPTINQWADLSKQAIAESAQGGYTSESQL